ncbi:hypothetical protein GCM10028785_20400 [Hydrogenophaga soli]
MRGFGKRLEAGEFDGLKAHGGQAKGEAAMIPGGLVAGAAERVPVGAAAGKAPRLELTKEKCCQRFI